MFMEQFSWSVHFDMENEEKPVQNIEKKRSQSDKIGRLKYNQQLLKRVLSEVEEVKQMQRTIVTGLKGYFEFDQSIIEKAICSDELDKEILFLLFEVGSSGLLPKDLANKLAQYKITRHQISRRLLRMNRLMEKEYGEHIAEKQGWHWALTSFAREVWGKTEKDS